MYVFDPKAMHTIAVKEQYVYAEAARFLRQVVSSLGISCVARNTRPVVRVNMVTHGPGLLATTGVYYIFLRVNQ